MAKVTFIARYCAVCKCPQLQTKNAVKASVGLETLRDLKQVLRFKASFGLQTLSAFTRNVVDNLMGDLGLLGRSVFDYNKLSLLATKSRATSGKESPIAPQNSSRLQ